MEIQSSLAFPTLGKAQNLTSAFNSASAADHTSFGSLVKGTLDSINTTQKGAEQEIARAVNGQSPDLHQTIVALQTADLKFQFGLQVRNKIVGAFEEIMRMQV